MAVKMILTAPYGTHKYRKASSRRKRQPSDFTYMIYFVRMKVRNVPFPRILSPTENPVLLTYILWHILRIGSIPSDKKENDNRYKTKIIKEKAILDFLKILYTLVRAQQSCSANQVTDNPCRCSSSSISRPTCVILLLWNN